MIFNNLILSVIFWILIGIIAFFAIWFFSSWIFLTLFCFTIPMKKEYEKPSRFYNFLFNYGYWLLIYFGRIKLKVIGLEKVPFDKKFLFVSNHRSKFDNMIHSVVLRKENIAFVSKKENFNIPIGRHYMRRACYISLDRHSIKSGIDMINHAIHLIENDYASVGLFPEGTRSKDCRLADFKDGCFKIAEKAKCPIVIGITKGTENIHKNWPFKRTKVTFEILDVLYPKDLEGKKSVEISKMVRQKMLTQLEDALAPSNADISSCSDKTNEIKNAQ